MATDLASSRPTVDRAVQHTLIDVAYEAAVARRARLDLTDAVRAAWDAGATREQLDTAAGGLVEIADVLDGEPLWPRPWSARADESSGARGAALPL